MVVSVTFPPGSEVEYNIMILMLVADISVGLDSNGTLIVVVVASVIMVYILAIFAIVTL